jgi:hypothetical protein
VKLRLREREIREREDRMKGRVIERESEKGMDRE